MPLPRERVGRGWVRGGWWRLEGVKGGLEGLENARGGWWEG